MILNTLIMSLLIKCHYQCSTHLDKKSLYIPFFFYFYPFTSHLGAIFDHHLFCNSLLLVLLSSLFGAAIIFRLGFTIAFWLVLVLCLLILRPILCTSSTVHKTLWTFATQNLKSLGWAPMSLLSESITFCLTQLCTNLACVPSVPWISLLWTKHKSPTYFSDTGVVMCSCEILSMM